VLTPEQKLTILRAIDKLDRIGRDGVYELLTVGRSDGSGDFTPGAGLSEVQADLILEFLKPPPEGPDRSFATLARMERWFFVMAMPEAELDALYDKLASLPGRGVA
jgi:histidyl-tRNA synthetase